MSYSISISPGQMARAQELLAGIQHGYPRAMTRALNDASAKARTLTARKLKALLTADPERIDRSLSTTRATFSKLSATLNIAGQPIPLFRFDVSFLYPTVRGGVTARIYQSGGGRLHLKHAFVAKLRSGHYGVFSRTGKPRLPISEHHGPNAATAFERTPGAEAEIIAESADKLLSEFDRQVDLLLRQSEPA